MRVSVVIPAYNEEARLGQTLETVLAFFDGWAGYEPEILVVSDGSTDGTVAAAEEHAQRRSEVRVLAYEPNRGKGYAVRRGMLESTGSVAVLSDADLSTPITELPWFLEYQNGKRRIVIASRAWPSSEIGGWRPGMRTSAGIVFNRMVQLLAVPGVWDTQCGFKLFPAEAVRPVFGRCLCDGFAYDVEALAIARHLGYEILELGVSWDNSPASKVRLSRDVFPMTYDVVRTALRRRRGYYDEPIGDV